MLRRVGRVYAAELAKIWRTKFPYLGLVASALMALIARQAAESAWQTGQVTAGDYFSNSVNLATTITIPIFATIVASMLVASEMARGTFRTVLTRPISRGEFLTGKLLAALTYLVLLCLSNVLPTAAIALSYPVVPPGSEFVMIPGPGRQAGIFALALLLTFLPLAATVCFGFCISALSSNPATAVGVALGLYLSINPLKHLGDWGAERWIVSSYYDTAMGIASDMVSGIYPSFDEVPWVIGVSLATAAVFLVWGYASFLRRDLTV